MPVLGAVLAVLGISPFASSKGDEQTPNDQALAVELHLSVGDNVTHFRIPRGYLDAPSNLRGGEQEVLVIEAVLPTFEPGEAAFRFPSPIDVSDELLGLLDDPIRLSILVKRGRPYAKLYWRERIISRTVEAEFDRFGLSSRILVPEYPGQFSDGVARSTAIYFIPERRYSNDSQFFECFTDILRGDCRGHGNYNEHLYYQYYFPEELFRHWRELDQGVTALLTAFEEAVLPAVNQ